MNQATTSTSQKPTVVKAIQANEWGQIAGLEPHATYFVVRKPTAEYTRERSRELVSEVRSFLHEQRMLTEKQMQDLNSKYGEPAKAKAKEIRETLEKRFDEIAKEVEARIVKLEGELQERAPQVFKPRGKDAAASTSGETPGEMPTGEHAADTPAEPSGSSSKPSKKGARKTE